jgi:hypothetical protein
LAKNEAGDWYVRQHGYEDEEWDLFCLSPAHSAVRAAESLREEIALGRRYDAEAEEASGGRQPPG